jgi:hypothetical protein
MNSEQFIEFCRIELQKSYRNTKSGNKNDQQKHRTEGLLHGAVLMGCISKKEVQDMLEIEHQNTFGQSISERKLKSSKLAQLKKDSPDDYFEIPAIERKL